MDARQEDTNESEDRVYFDNTTPKVMAFFLFYSFAMFSLPFAAFYGTQHYLKELLEVDGFVNICWSVMASVVTIWAIIIMYAFQGYREDVNDAAAAQQSNRNLKKD